MPEDTPNKNPAPANGLPRLNLDFGSGKLTAVDHHGVPCVSFRQLCDFVGADYRRKADQAMGSAFMHGMYRSKDRELLLSAHLVPLWLGVLSCDDVGQEYTTAYHKWVGAAAELLSTFRAPLAGPSNVFGGPASGARLTKADLVPLSLGERHAIPGRVIHRMGLASREEHREALTRQGFVFVANDDRFADEPDYDPVTGPVEVWRRVSNGVVEWAELSHSGPFDEHDDTPSEQSWSVTKWDVDPRLIVD